MGPPAARAPRPLLQFYAHWLPCASVRIGGRCRRKSQREPHEYAYKVRVTHRLGAVRAGCASCSGRALCVACCCVGYTATPSLEGAKTRDRETSMGTTARPHATTTQQVQGKGAPKKCIDRNLASERQQAGHKRTPASGSRPQPPPPPRTLDRKYGRLHLMKTRPGD
jgi:hypothetical protein